MNPNPSGSQFVFLFGLPRSGTTWVGKIFDSHPQTLYKHEPDTFLRLPQLPWTTELSGANELRADIQQWLRLVADANTSPVAGSWPMFAKSYRSPRQHAAHWVSALVGKMSGPLYRQFPVPLCADGKDIPCLVWKSVRSLGRLGVFLRVAERRKAIVMIRHPCGVIASWKRGIAKGHLRTDESTDYHLFGLLLGTGPGKRCGLTLDEIREMQSEERMAWKWVLVHEKMLEDTAGFEDDVLVLRYEDVCADPKGCVRRPVR